MNKKIIYIVALILLITTPLSYKLYNKFSYLLEKDGSLSKTDIQNYEKSLSKTTSAIYKNANILPTQDQKIKFCIVIPSYNNEKYTVHNLNSIFIQDYHNWKIIYIDDASTDKTVEEAKKIRAKGNFPYTKFKIFSHAERMQSSAYSFHEAAHNHCTDDEVMVQLDGDDMLYSSKVLSNLAKIYSDKKTWITFGSYTSTLGKILSNFNGHNLVENIKNLRSSSPWNTSHLRTSYTWLFKKIKLEDLQYNGKFIPSAGDLGVMFPMLEMAGPQRTKYISKIFYIYRLHNNNHADENKKKHRKEISKYIKSLPVYEQLPKDFIPPVKKMTIDNVYVVNLDQATERWKSVTKQLKDANIEHQRFSATNGYKIKITDLKTKEVFSGHDLKNKSKQIDQGKIYKITCNPDDNNPTELNFKGFLDHRNESISAGELGIWCSMKRIWKDALNKDYNNIIILEDDIILKNDFQNKLNNFTNSLPKDFDLAYLGVTIKNNKKSIVKINNYVNGFTKKAKGWGAYAILYSSNAIHKLMAIDEYTYPIDNFYWALSNARENNLYPPLKEELLNSYFSSKKLLDVRNMEDELSIKNMGRNYN